jgi:FixJ family two-component response regulator
MKQPTNVVGQELKRTNVESDLAEVVCLVEDDPSVRKSIGRLLDSAGFRTRAFNDPQPFLAHLAQNPVPLVVLDIWMESMTGMELLAHLCARSPETRVIFITGHDDPAAEATVMSAGAFAFFIKPFDHREFLAAVHGALGHSVSEKKAIGTRLRALWKGGQRV